MRKHTLLLGATGLLLLLLPLVSHAQLVEIIPIGCRAEGAPVEQCGINEMIELAIRISQFLLGIVGSVTLIMFIYGGIIWMTSAGNSERVQKGKSIFIGSLVGLAIIFGSSVIILMVVAALTGQPFGSNIRLFPGNTQDTPSNPALSVPK